MNHPDNLPQNKPQVPKDGIDALLDDNLEWIDEEIQKRYGGHL